MLSCSLCRNFLNQTGYASTIVLERSFTKIGGSLHFAFDRQMVCREMAEYAPDTVVLAGNGAVESEKGPDCWAILTNELKALGLIGETFDDPLVALTWLAAHKDLFGADAKEALDKLDDQKRQVVGSSASCPTKAREVLCTACNRKFKISNSPKVLIITTNWDLGLFRAFDNVVQLHGRCDFPKEAILPLQNISSLMPRTIEHLQALNSGFFPATFLERCLKNAKSLIFWGTGLNDYDAALWYFLAGYMRQNRDLRVSIAAKDEAGFNQSQSRVSRFFSPIPINRCLCSMLSFD